jgi:hypothetical protein
MPILEPEPKQMQRGISREDNKYLCREISATEVWKCNTSELGNTKTETTDMDSCNVSKRFEVSCDWTMCGTIT